MSKLTDIQIDILKLINRSIKDDGWAKVSKPLWATLIFHAPKELVESERLEEENIAGMVRFTNEGKIVIKWLV